MNLSDSDQDRCYAALSSRDPRFDGRFFVGVTTTGVFCRPVCPARKPRRENARFYPSAAAAAMAGFRPCLRCRPETAPGSPAWLGSSHRVGRARRLIDDGYLDAHSTDELADRVGISTRQLRRLCITEFGAAPVKLAQMRRLLLAKQLLVETALPVTDIAYASGYQSLRRFNVAIKKTFSRTPTALRGRVKNDELVSVQLRYRPPFSWADVLRFLAPRATPGVEEVTDVSYRRTFNDGHRFGLIELTDQPDARTIRVRFSPALLPSLSAICAAVRRVCDLDADVEVVQRALSQHIELRAAIAATTVWHLPGSWSPFECAVRAIVGQQISVKATRTILGRIASQFGHAVPAGMAGDSLHACFPTPEQLAVADLTVVGLPKRRAATINRLAQAMLDDELRLEPGCDPNEAHARLVALPGIGDWTAQYILMRGLKEPDAFPAGDLVVQKALATDGERPNERQTRELSQAWRPWRAYAVSCLWQYATENQ